MGLLVAIGIVLSQFLSFYYPPSTTIIKFGISYIPIILVSLFFGPIYGAWAGALQDVIGYFLLGTARGAFYVGFTINAILYGVLPYYLMKLTKNVRQTTFYTINVATVTIFALLSFLYLFDIKVISNSDYFTTVYRYLFICFALLTSVALIFIATRQHLQHKEQNDFQKLFFIVLVLYMVTSLILTPLWLYDLMGLSIWAQLPLRIIKMPFEVIVYTLILERLLKVSKKVSNLY